MAAKTKIEQIVRTPGGPDNVSVLPDYEFIVNGTFITTGELSYIAGEVFIYEGTLESGSESSSNFIWLDDNGTINLAGHGLEELYDSLPNDDTNRFTSELHAMLEEVLADTLARYTCRPSGKTKLHRDFKFTPLTLKA